MKTAFAVLLTFFGFAAFAPIVLVAVRFLLHMVIGLDFWFTEDQLVLSSLLGFCGIIALAFGVNMFDDNW